MAKSEFDGDYTQLPGGTDSGLESGALRTHQSATLAKILEEESVHSMPKMFAMLFTTGGTLLFTVLKGGRGVNYLSVVCGTGLYWFLSLAVVPFTLCIAYFVSVFFLCGDLCFGVCITCFHALNHL